MNDAEPRHDRIPNDLSATLLAMQLVLEATWASIRAARAWRRSPHGVEALGESLLREFAGALTDYWSKGALCSDPDHATLLRRLEDIAVTICNRWQATNPYPCSC